MFRINVTFMHVFKESPLVYPDDLLEVLTVFVLDEPAPISVEVVVDDFALLLSGPLRNVYCHRS